MKEDVNYAYFKYDGRAKAQHFLQGLGQLIFLALFFLGSAYELFHNPLIYLPTYFVWGFVASVLVSVGMHVGLVHQAIPMRRFVSRLVGWASTWMVWASPIGFGLPHWGHHRYMDTEKDPHSPAHKGYLKSLSYWTHTAPATGKDLLRAIAFVRPLIRDPFQMSLFRHTIAWALSPLLWVVPLAFFFDPWMIFFYGWILPAGMALLGLAGGVAIHWFNGPHNIPWLRAIMFFENRHDHHHKHPTDAKMDRGWKIASHILSL
jgi:stearoyl-CoA desaturase (delta-9 desaturase)